MRWTPALVWPQHNRNFRDARADLRRFDNQFGSKLHSGAANAQPIVHCARKTAQAAITVADSGAKKHVEQSCEAGIADIFVAPGHGAWPNPSLKAIAHHQVVAFAPLQNESRNVGEIVAVIGVTHDDE